jgi:hypothetical protein
VHASIRATAGLSRLWFAALFTLAHAAFAHAIFVSPPPRDANSYGTACGTPRTQNPTVYTAGETITVEYILQNLHPPNIAFVIDFSFANDTGFTPLTGQMPADVDAGYNQHLSAQVTLPDTPCTACTLDLVYLAGDPQHAAYHSCADIVLLPSGAPTDAGSPPVPDAGTSRIAVGDVEPDAGAPPPAPPVPRSSPTPRSDAPQVLEGGCASAGNEAASLAALLALATLMWRRPQITALRCRRNRGPSTPA